jgi:hypothetical protein
LEGLLLISDVVGEELLSRLELKFSLCSVDDEVFDCGGGD